jgi:hypothetical protein
MFLPSIARESESPASMELPTYDRRRYPLILQRANSQQQVTVAFELPQAPGLPCFSLRGNLG